ncbi:MAG: GNAT family N-acetyltransferase [Bacteroidetes bacterium]|nr:GNAT family N-acetyltransferase [Bacteroidota bacterium]
MENIKIRPALKSDSKSILRLINELAEFEKLDPPDSRGKRRIIKDAFSGKPLFNVLLAESNGDILGYAFYFFTYSSFLAKKTLYLEDIFISGKFRNKGIGKLFFADLKRIAKKNKCGRMEWVVLDWNKNAIEFYTKLGAEELKMWKTFRLKL